jgi:hypothetical protein
MFRRMNGGALRHRSLISQSASVNACDAPARSITPPIEAVADNTLLRRWFMVCISS